MTINWPIVIGVLTTGGVLGGGVLGVLIQGFFHKPEKRANINSVNADVSIRLLRESIDSYQQLKKEYVDLKRHSVKCARKLEDTQKRLRQTRDALRLLTGMPILQQVGQNDYKLDELIEALESIQKIIDQP